VIICKSLVLRDLKLMGVGMFINISNWLIIVLSANKNIFELKKISMKLPNPQ